MSGKRRADTGPAASKATTRAKRPRTRKQQVLRVAKWLGIAFLVFALVAVGGFVYLYKTIDIPKPNEDFLTQTSTIYYADGKTELGDFAVQNRDIIPLEDMPENLQNAVVAAENRTFWTDKGIDPKGIIRAAFSNASGNSTQGASTITQQYVKILYLSQERSYKRKVKEAILSLKVQREQSKSEILRNYLNTIYFGRSAYGVQAAAKAYFDKDAKDLDLKESAVLASVLNNPTHFDPANGKDSKHDLHERYDYVLNGMASAGNITEEQAQKASRRLPKFPKVQAESKFGGQRGHMLKMVRDELRELGYSDQEIDGGGLQVTTTFTKKAMDAAREGVEAEKPEGFGDKQLHIAVASVEPGTGALRGFYGGQDYLDSQINWAETGGSPGSSFKPFALATGLKEGFSLKDTFDGNSPYYYNGEGTGDRVRNEGSGPDGLGTDYGSAVNLTYATEQSINTAYADLTMSMPDGPQKILDTANALGIPKWDKSQNGINHLHTSPGLEPVSGIALGSATISPINMANAYASIANGGERADVHVIEKVVDKDNGHDYTWKQHTTPAFDPQDEQMNGDIAADTSYALQQVVLHATGQNAIALGRPAAGKTGTATNSKDQVSSSWFVGYTPQLATAVMYVRGQGNEQLDGWLPSYFGADYPTRTWTAVMRADMEGVPVEAFPLPANLDGEAPESGHEPPPPPPPSPTRIKPTQTPTETTSPSQTPTTESPSESPSQSPSDSCGLLGCDSPSNSPTPSNSASTHPGGGQGGGQGGGVGGGHGGQGGRARRGRRRHRAA